MRRYCILILFLFSGLYLAAQARPNEQRIQLLKQLRITALQRAQLQQLIQEERLEEFLRNKRLQQILTPQQRKRLMQLQKENNPSAKDSLHYRKLQP
jgi:hypothetical protein